ncbi:MAG: c-type cytochrome [Chitinophagaceae bacterium]|nr:c-type cytochrome [Chitinophagaceae bacterium]
MKPSKLLSVLLFTGSVFAFSCKEGAKKDPKPIDIQELTKDQPETHGTEIKETDITLGTPLDQAMVSIGKSTYELKCQSCHRLTEEKLVGPGWKGVTQRREPLWIMNMITNVDMMLASDPEAQKLLELCLVRMPNQNLVMDDARKLLEFMRSNDGVK